MVVIFFLFYSVTFRQNGYYNNISSVFNHHLFKSSLDLACYLIPPQNLKHPWELISSRTRNKRDVIFSHIRTHTLTHTQAQAFTHTRTHSISQSSRNEGIMIFTQIHYAACTCALHIVHIVQCACAMHIVHVCKYKTLQNGLVSNLTRIFSGGELNI